MNLANPSVLDRPALQSAKALVDFTNQSIKACPIGSKATIRFITPRRTLPRTFPNATRDGSADRLNQLKKSCTSLVFRLCPRVLSKVFEALAAPSIAGLNFSKRSLSTFKLSANISTTGFSNDLVNLSQNFLKSWSAKTAFFCSLVNPESASSCFSSAFFLSLAVSACSNSSCASVTSSDASKTSFNTPTVTATNPAAADRRHVVQGQGVG